MKIHKFDHHIIENSFKQAERKLLNRSNATYIVYSNFEVTTFDDNNKSLLGEIGSNSIVYCLWLGNRKSSIKPIYVGHAHKNISRQRIRAHLTKKNKATGSQLEKVKDALRNEKIIALSYLIIEPAYMRKALEEWLIERHSKTLNWNKSGKLKQTT